MSVVRASKYRHVYGTAHRKEVCYDNLKVDTSSAESYLIKANKSVFAFPWTVGGGGAICVWPVACTGRLPDTPNLITGHTTKVIDFEFSPFMDDFMATGCEDGHVKAWRIPDITAPLTAPLVEPAIDLLAHTKKVLTVDFHPLAQNVLITSSLDQTIKLWDLEAQALRTELRGPTDATLNISWHYSGSQFVTACKDKKLRIYDPRTSPEAVMSVTGHDGHKGSRAIWLGDSDRIFSVGSNRTAERQISIWDARNFDKALSTQTIDQSSGLLMPFYDPDTRVMFLAGKGESNIKLYEITDSAPFCHYLNDWKATTPQRGVCHLPKTVCDVGKNEFMRFMRITGSTVEPVGFTVPRKSEFFQDDIFPDTQCGEPSLSSGEWFEGQNQPPKLVSLKPETMKAQSEVAAEEKKGPKYDFKTELSATTSAPARDLVMNNFDRLMKKFEDKQIEREGSDDEWK